MERRQILQKLFGDHSEEEEAYLNDGLNHQANPVFDGGLEHENEGKAENKGKSEVRGRGAPKGVYHNHIRSSRSTDTENVVPDEDATYEGEEECTKTKVTGKKVASSDVYEIPLLQPPVAPDQMATIRLSNVIGIDPNPFDPMTYVDEDFYVTDEFGSKRCIPHTNIIRWREVKNPDGTTSVESNARFVTWSDGSLQLLIGNEAFDVSEQDARDIQSHIFVKHEKGIYQSQGKIPRRMKFMPSSLSSNSHRSLTALVESRNKKVNKVRHYEPEVDPERLVEQNKKVEMELSKASKQLNKKKKKAAGKYKRPKGRKDRQLTPGFLEDEDNEQKFYELPASVHHLDLHPEMEAKAEKRIMNAKKETKGARSSSLSAVKLTRGSLNVSKEEKFELEHGYKGKEVKGSLSHLKVEEIEEEEEGYEDSDVDAEEGSKGKGTSKQYIGLKGKGKSKQYIESDEDTPPRLAVNRRQLTIAYDDNDE